MCSLVSSKVTGIPVGTNCVPFLDGLSFTHMRMNFREYDQNKPRLAHSVYQGIVPDLSEIQCNAENQNKLKVKITTQQNTEKKVS